MSTTPIAAEDTRPYVEAVQQRIAGLPPARQAELLDDLTHHLTELAAEPGPPLDETLGSPAAFADEYLSSAGIEPTPDQSDPHSDHAYFRAGQLSQRLWHGLVDHPATRSVRAFLPELRPAWWAARGYLVVAAWAAADDRAALPFPNVDLPGHRFTGTVLALLAAAASVRLARRSAEGRHGRWVLAANGVGIVAALIVAAQGAAPDGYASASVYDIAEAWPEPTTGYVTASDGRPITNLFVYDADGNLLDGVYVYDQDGLPVETPAFHDPDLQTTIAVDATGNVVVNQYPQVEERVFYGQDGTTSTVRVATPVPDIPVMPEDPATTSTTVVP